MHGRSKDLHPFPFRPRFIPLSAPTKAIHNMFEKLVFDCVGFFSKFSSSLAPCARTMVARSRSEFREAFLSNSQFFRHVVYIVEGWIPSDCKSLVSRLRWFESSRPHFFYENSF